MNTAECIAEIERCLFAADESKNWIHRVATDFVESNSSPDAVFAPGLTDPIPATPLSPSDRESIWRRAVAAL